MKKAIPAIILGITTSLAFGGNASASIEDDDKYVITQKNEYVTLSNGEKIKTNVISPVNITISKSFEKEIKNDVKENIAFYASDFDKFKENNESAKVKVKYVIKSNNENYASIRAFVYFQDKYIKVTKGSFNLNYAKTWGLKDHTIRIEQFYKNKNSEKMINDYMIKKTKAKFGVSAGFENLYSTPYYFKENGKVVMTFNGNILERRYNDFFYVDIPSKYLNFD